MRGSPGTPRRSNRSAFVVAATLRRFSPSPALTSRHQAASLGLASRQIGRTPSAEEIEIARTRMDFYHVIATGGRAMTALGVVIATFGVARQLRS